MKEKAQFALNASKSDGSHQGAAYGAQWKVDPADDADELEIFAGKTRLVEAKRLSPSPSVQSVPSGGSDLPPLRLQQHPRESLSPYEQDYKSMIAPPTVPPIPQAPASASGSAMPSPASWYPQSHGYNPGASSYTHQHPSPTSPYGYDEAQGQGQTQLGYSPAQEQRASASGYSAQQWQAMRGHAPPPHLQVPQHASASHHHSQQQHSQQQHMHAIPGQQQQQQAMHLPSSHPHSQHSQHSPVSPQQLEYPTSAQYRPPQQQQQQYPVDPSFQGMQQGYMPPPEMVALGLASRESRLDQRWASFIHESGYLDGINFGGAGGGGAGAGRS